MQEIRAIVNQTGVAMELHRNGQNPVILTLVSVSQLGAYRDRLAEDNPDMRYATIGQLATGIARLMFGDAARANGVTVSDYPWTYNASTETYSKG